LPAEPSTPRQLLCGPAAPAERGQQVGRQPAARARLPRHQREQPVEGAIRSDACQAREAGSGRREQGTERNSPQSLSGRSLNPGEGFPGSSALQKKEVMFLEEKGVKD